MLGPVIVAVIGTAFITSSTPLRYNLALSKSVLNHLELLKATVGHRGKRKF